MRYRCLATLGLDATDDGARRNVISDAEKERVKLNSELKNLDLQSRRIQAKQSVVEKRLKVLGKVIDKHKNQLAAQVFRSFPVEVLSMIFRFCADEILPVFCTRSTHSQWTIIAVCKRWRNVALSTPQLWAHIEVDIQDAVKRRIKNAVPRLQEILTRSAQQPLLLKVIIAEYRHNLLRAILVHSSRWKRVSLEIFSCGTTPKIIKALNDHRGKFPMLEALTLGGRIALAQDNLAISAFQDCPKLRHVIFESQQQCIQGVTLCWDHISSVDAIVNFDSEVPNIIKQIPKARHLGLNVMMPLFSMGPNPPAVLPHLESFHYSGSFERIVSLQLPALTELSLSCRDILDRDLVEFLGPCAESLKTLELQATNRLSAEMFPSCHLPNLERLEIFGSPIDDAIFTLLTLQDAKDTDQIQLPSLTTLHLGFDLRVTKALVMMLESRSESSVRQICVSSGSRPAVSHLRTVLLGCKARTMGVPEPETKVALDSLHRLREDGMEIETLTPGRPARIGDADHDRTGAGQQAVSARLSTILRHWIEASLE